MTAAPHRSVIYHNPRCSTSRNALALLRAGGETPEIVDYQKTPLDRDTILGLVRDSGLSMRDAIRRKSPLFAELGLDDPATDEAALLDALVAHPELLERPFVVTAKGTRMARPLEALFEIMEHPPARFTKENGQVIER